MLERTIGYWREWMRYLSIPYEWQDAVIRAAITLKLCQYEATGAIVAALTTSIPEAAGTERNWDYRYCWLRDAAFTVRALNRLGATRTMEEYIRYVFNLIAARWRRRSRPGVRHHLRAASCPSDRSRAWPAIAAWVRYAWAMLPGASARTMSTARWCWPRRSCSSTAGWSIAATSSPSAAGAHGPAGAANRGAARCRAVGIPRPRLGAYLFGGDVLGRLRPPGAHRHRARTGRPRTLLARRGGCNCTTASSSAAWNEKLGLLRRCLRRRATWMRACCCLRTSASSRPATRASSPPWMLSARHWAAATYMFRYIAPDDFGTPETSFNICTFWYIEALAATGRERRGARDVRAHARPAQSAGAAVGGSWPRPPASSGATYPQTYSLVGLIQAAMRLSRRWEDAL